VVALVKKAVDATNAKFARVEQIKKFKLLTKELDHEDGELTATQKVKRSIIEERFEGEIESMYR
jgi:long-chain acyl-CoA synthetase